MDLATVGLYGLMGLGVCIIIGLALCALLWQESRAARRQKRGQGQKGDRSLIGKEDAA